ncbi:hypothetical protein ROHU_008583 [Labeo rohita]|uniref:Uncharacterized protein n=1 Tax=Labeo rohita TaxID=84645 RepID=A0A498M936_LABRO|nr:hypothetical protein ROHU_008583 [Labeo rohita]
MDDCCETLVLTERTAGDHPNGQISTDGIEPSDRGIIQEAGDPPGARGPSQQGPDRQETTRSRSETAAAETPPKRHDTSSSTSAQTEERCPSSPQTQEKLLPTT